jgi:hypothetical protein
MSRKIYRLNQRKTTATFTLSTNNGKVSVGYKFDHGNPILNVPPRLALNSEFAQNLLEDSLLFKRRIVVLERTMKAETPVKEEEIMNHVKGVTNVAQAVDYIANTYAVQVKTTKEAVAFAKKHGFDFPDMKVKD